MKRREGTRFPPSRAGPGQLQWGAVAMLASCATAGPSAPPLGATATAKACVGAIDCKPDELCTAPQCVAIFPRAYVLTVEKAKLSPYDGNGNPWDKDGDGDPVAAVSVGGREVCRSAPAKDQLDVTLAVACAVSLDAKSEVRFTLGDDDGGTVQEGMLKIVSGADLVPAVRLGFGEQQDALGYVRFRLAPAPTGSSARSP
ncbi:MAG: hypothetical protein EXR79_14230 [Myxococcales bacterium]|nr:hypothetical protein [Myxococcales bacterium]